MLPTRKKLRTPQSNWPQNRIELNDDFGLKKERTVASCSYCLVTTSGAHLKLRPCVANECEPVWDGINLFSVLLALKQ